MTQSVEPEGRYASDAVVAEVNEYERVESSQSDDLRQLILLQVDSPEMLHRRQVLDRRQSTRLQVERLEAGEVVEQFRFHPLEVGERRVEHEQTAELAEHLTTEVADTHLSDGQRAWTTITVLSLSLSLVVSSTSV